MITWRAFARSISMVAASSVLAFFTTIASAEPPATAEAGKLKVALNGDMPMTGLDGDQLIGTDGELMVLIAERLGLEVEPHMMDWSAEIQSTKQGKVDIMHGAMGWIEERSKIMLLSDPIYYFGTLVAQKTDNNWSTFEDLKGRSVATVSGFTLVPELKGVEGIGEVKLYDTTDGALRDLIAGRVDMAILDPPLMQLAIN
ncbi:MAG: substrate-binding periplasmic protein, partial [Geminicoccaceae bacterium]